MDQRNLPYTFSIIKSGIVAINIIISKKKEAYHSTRK